MSQPIVDIYPFLNIKKGSDLLDRIAVSLNWVAKEHRRRLEAYTVLAAYTANMSNVVRRTPVDGEDIPHEYGDANFVCTAMSNALVGDQVQIVAPKAPEQEEFYRQWASKEFFFAKLVANEYKASNLGDCVYRLGYSPLQGRVTVKTFDPGYWFPFNLGEPDERHIFAWEEELNGAEEIYKEEYVRIDSGRGKGQIVLSAGWYKKDGSTGLDALHLIKFANDENGKPLDKRKLRIDFFPIIYIPNIYREGWDCGESDLTGVWRILDQLSNTYTDEAANSFLMGLAMLWLNKDAFGQLPPSQVQAGSETASNTLKIGKNKILPGQAGIVDNSTINDALIGYQHELEKKLLTNTFLGPLSSGNTQTGSGDRTTGIFQLKGGLLERFVNVKRLMRQPKYDKLIDYVARMTVAYGSDADKKLLAKNQARIQFGNILPIDQKSMVDNLQKIKERLGNKDLKDNLREAGLTVNEELRDAPVEKPAQTGAQ